MKQKFKPIKVKLKNSKEVTIRSAEQYDAEKLLKTIKEYVNDSDYIPKISEEIKITVQSPPFIWRVIQGEFKTHTVFSS